MAQLINPLTQEIAFTGNEQECKKFLEGYEPGKPVLTFIPDGSEAKTPAKPGNAQIDLPTEKT